MRPQPALVAFLRFVREHRPAVDAQVNGGGGGGGGVGACALLCSSGCEHGDTCALRLTRVQMCAHAMQLAADAEGLRIDVAALLDA